MRTTLCLGWVVMLFLCGADAWAQADRGDVPRDDDRGNEAPADPGRGSDLTCRACRARFLEVRDRCREMDILSDVCHQRGLDALRRCLRECGYLDLNIEEPPDSNPVADPAIVAGIDDLMVTAGEVEFALGIDTSTSGPFRRLIVGFAGLTPGVFEEPQVELGNGLLNYIAEHEEPPACDIIIFPPAPGSPAGAITKLFLDEPYDSLVYGSEYLTIEFGVAVHEPTPTTIQLFGEGEVERHGGELTILPTECEAQEVIALPPPTFLRGDANSDSTTDVSDPVTILLYLFAAGTVECQDAADFNDDGSVNVSDAILLMTALFENGEMPLPGCGPDETEDELSCAAAAYECGE